MKKIFILLLIVCYAAVNGNADYTEQDLKEICRGREFEFIAHTDIHKYIVCIQDGGIEKACSNTDCFDELNPPCSATCPTSNANDLARCNDPKVKALDRVADSQDCEQYYLCMGANETPLHLRCPPNQHYSEKEKKCMDVFEANCAVTTRWCQNKRNGTTYSSENCYEYYECEGQETFKMSCPFNEHFNAELGKCIKGTCVGDTRKPSCSNVADGTRLYHAKCNKYYICLNRALFEAQCGSGFRFDAIAGMCVRDVNNSCNDI